MPRQVKEKLGDHPDMSIAEARQLTRTVQTLAAIGIDPQEGLHERLIRELKAKGTKPSVPIRVRQRGG